MRATEKFGTILRAGRALRCEMREWDAVTERSRITRDSFTLPSTARVQLAADFVFERRGFLPEFEGHGAKWGFFVVSR